jgi:hypothetical protein
MQTPKQMVGGQRRFWTTGEKDSLISLYPNTRMGELVQLLKRPASAISCVLSGVPISWRGNIAGGLELAIAWVW